jgi:low molecular weight phosphotyrosine protein phosphatase
MRSAMAEFLMRQALKEAGLEGQVRIMSAGLLASAGREAHPWAQEASADIGIALAEHRAKLLTREMMERADCIFAMDFQNKSAHTLSRDAGQDLPAKRLGGGRLAISRDSRSVSGRSRGDAILRSAITDVHSQPDGLDISFTPRRRALQDADPARSSAMPLLAFTARAEPVGNSRNSRPRIRERDIVITHAGTPGHCHRSQARPEIRIFPRPAQRTPSPQVA